MFRRTPDPVAWPRARLQPLRDCVRCPRTLLQRCVPAPVRHQPPLWRRRNRPPAPVYPDSEAPFLPSPRLVQTLPERSSSPPRAPVKPLLLSSFEFLLQNCRQEVVPGHRAAGLTLKRLLQALLVFVRGRDSDVRGGQDREDIRLHYGNEHVQSNESDGNQRRKNSQQNAQHWGLAPAPNRRTGQQAHENPVNHVARENVRPQANCKR